MPDAQGASSGSGGFNLGGPIQSAIGIAQTIGGYIQAHRAQKQLEGMVDSYRPNASILDYYNKAINNYSANPYNSAMYRAATQRNQQNFVTAINSAKDRRGALGALPGLVSATNNADLNAVAGATNQQSKSLAQLGSATQVKAAEDFKPFQLKYNLQSQKAQGGNQIMNAGLQNVVGGLQSATDLSTAAKIYGF